MLFFLIWVNNMEFPVRHHVRLRHHDVSSCDPNKPIRVRIRANDTPTPSSEHPHQNNMTGIFYVCICARFHAYGDITLLIEQNDICAVKGMLY